MKKIKSLIVVVVLLLVLTGCSSSTQDTRKFELDKDGVKTTMVYSFKGDKVTKQTTENIIKYDQVGISSKEEAEAFYGPFVTQFQNVKGITHKMEYGDKEAVEDMTIDYGDVDFKEIRELPGMSFDGDAETKGISMRKSEELLNSQGFTEVK